MAYSLSPVDVRENITREEFYQEYVKGWKPVVLKNYCADWPAKEKWTFDYFRKNYGHIEVPVMEEAFAVSGNAYGSADAKMKFGDYLELISTQPTKKRIFLFNIFKVAPDLRKDFTWPEIIKGYIKSQPFVFFGGATSFVDAHMDLDNSHVFMTQFSGLKKVILFHPKYSPHLYRHPFTVSTNVDVGKPDFEKYPKMKNLPGVECTLGHGDTLFMPSGWWHYIYYQEGGFALSLRAMPDSLSRKIQGAYQIAKLIGGDRIATRMFGVKKWYGMKEKWAQARARTLPEPRA